MQTPSQAVADPRLFADGLPSGTATDTEAIRWAVGQVVGGHASKVEIPGGEWSVTGPLLDVDVARGDQPFDGFTFEGHGRRTTRLVLDPDAFPAGASVFAMYGAQEHFVDGALRAPEFRNFSVEDRARRSVPAHVFDARFCHRGVVDNVGAFAIKGAVLRHDVAYDWMIDKLFTSRCSDPNPTGDAADGAAATEGWGTIHEFRRVDAQRWNGNNNMSNCQLLGSDGWGMILDGSRRKKMSSMRWEGRADPSGGGRGHLLCVDTIGINVGQARFGQGGVPPKGSRMAHVRLVDAKGTSFSACEWSKVLARASECAIQLDGSTTATVVDRTCMINGSPDCIVDDCASGHTNRISPTLF
jgi:hypothetical protein